MDTVYDTVIVGAGSAGCVLAARLSADPGQRVLLIEAGPDYPDPASLPPEIADGTRLPRGHDWGYRAEPAAPGAAGAELPRGRLVGGCSAVNACFALRGHPGDYDGWAAAGNPGWSWADVEPVFAAIETDLDRGHQRGHGACGPLPIRRYAAGELTPPHRAFLDAAVAAGHPWVDDHNEAGAVGAGRLPVTCVGGRRISCAEAFLAPARPRRNLTVRPDTLVDRVDIVAGRAVAVRLADGTRIPAGRVVLAAGAYASPAILLRSGAGAPADLAGAGIAPVAELPGVGYGLADHPAVALDFTAPADWPLAPSFQSIVTARGGPGGPPDLHIVVGGAYADESRPTGRMASVFVAVLAPVSRGRVWLRDADPRRAPRIDLAHLRDPADADVLADGVARAFPLAVAVAGDAPVSRPPVEPGPSREWLRANCWSYHHPVGTCAMGPDPATGAVVDAAGRVHGVEGLHVADASVMPAIPRANTNLPTVMLAWKLAGSLTG